MNILFVHDAFPGQFIHLFKHLITEGKHTVMVASRKGSVAKLPCRQFVYDVFSSERAGNWNMGANSHAYELGLNLVKQVIGLVGTDQEPNIIVSHASTGAAFYLKDIFPKARFVSLCEWYYQQPKIKQGTNVKVSAFIKAAHSASLKNLPIERDFLIADATYSPTRFQKEQFPAYYQDKIVQIHDGIDTDLYSPDPDATFEANGHVFTKDDEVITYAARGMEKARGFPQFMQAIAEVLKVRPKAHVLIAAADRVCYGNKTDPGLKQWAADNVNYDPERVHYVGLLPEHEFTKMLQISSLHVYLTIPFVLSWSMLNAMSVGVRVLASDNKSVREAISEGVNGHLVPFDDVSAIAVRMTELLEITASTDSSSEAVLRAARQTIVDRYDSRSCLKQQLEIMGLGEYAN